VIEQVSGWERREELRNDIINWYGAQQLYIRFEHLNDITALVSIIDLKGQTLHSYASPIEARFEGETPEENAFDAMLKHLCGKSKLASLRPPQAIFARWMFRKGNRRPKGQPAAFKIQHHEPFGYIYISLPFQPPSKLYDPFEL